MCLNESPSQKEGKWVTGAAGAGSSTGASMKVPPKRKGNSRYPIHRCAVMRLNESPSQKEGKCPLLTHISVFTDSLNESPSQKEGK